MSLILGLIVLGAVVMGAWQFVQFNDGRLHLVFCDVGQGDAIYLKAPNGKELLIDGGPDESVLDCLSSERPFYDRKIDLLASTHPQADHLTGLIPVLERYNIDYILLENIINQTAIFSQFENAVKEEKAKIYNPRAGDKIKLGDLELVFYWPKEAIGDKKIWDEDDSSEPEIKNLNDYSLVLEVKYGDFRALLTGDAETDSLEQITGLGKVNILKVSHHGSKNGLSEKSLEILRPNLAVISVGENNRFGHPAPETLKLLQKAGIKVLRTNQKGKIRIISDGYRWFVD
ncbi:hypothetical protein HY439_03785 [Candidatus Microgenomates bacterium]|nr:hypothetical protein [Candidatus Microgenomates bacterium]